MTRPDLRLEQVQPLLDDLQRATAAAGPMGRHGASVRPALDAYVRVVRALRAVALDARGRIERAAPIVAEARLVARRNRRRAEKTVARRRRGSTEGAP